MSSSGAPREPTGGMVYGSEGPTIRIQRSLTHPPEDVWAHLADPRLLGRWYGTYTGDPATGSVQLTMVEAPDQPGECTIEVCERPHRLHVVLPAPGGTPWRLRVSLDASGAGGGTDLVFRQPITGLEDQAADVGPGWEYYLDRLRVALDGGDVDVVDFAAYHPGQRAHYTPGSPDAAGAAS